MVQVQARKPRQQVHGRRKPYRALDIAAPCGDARRRLLGQRLLAHAAREPGPPALRQHSSPSKTRDAFESRQCQGVSGAFPGKIEVRDDDDELGHERVF